MYGCHCKRLYLFNDLDGSQAVVTMVSGGWIYASSCTCAGRVPAKRYTASETDTCNEGI